MKTLLCLCVMSLLIACTPKKPPLEETQLIDGKSIIIPPEFDKIPSQGEQK